jgi:hypothetical protein
MTPTADDGSDAFDVVEVSAPACALLPDPPQAVATPATIEAAARAASRRTPTDDCGVRRVRSMGRTFRVGVGRATREPRVETR